MSEPFGIVSGAVSLAATFTACVDCFQYIQSGRHLRRDVQAEVVALHCVELRLTRWGQGVNIYSDPTMGRPDATESEVKAALDTLSSILALFADAAKISNRYAASARSQSDSAEEMDLVVERLADKMKQLARRRRQGGSVVKRASWALYHKEELRDLVTKITSLLDELERLFPPSRSAELALQEALEIGQKEELEMIENVAQGVDGTLQQAARKAFVGHQFRNIKIQGRAQSGDAFSPDWEGGAVGAFHTYDGVVVEKDGKALLGNKYGGKDFWDD